MKDERRKTKNERIVSLQALVLSLRSFNMPLRSKLVLFVLLALLVFCAPVLAAKKSRVGGFDGFVDRMGASARELGRANTGSADTSAMPGAYWNPAILAFRNSIAYSLHAEKRDLDRAGGSLGLEGKIGSRMGVGAAVLYRGDWDFEVIDEDDKTLGTASPMFTMMYLGFSYRLTRRDAFGVSFVMSYDNLDVAQFYDDADFEDGYRSPVTFNVGWLRQIDSKWSVGVTVKNLSFSKNLSATWTKTSNAEISSEGFRPKTLQVGVGYRSKVLNRNANLWLEAIDYMMSKAFISCDPDEHVWTARLGAEYEVIPNGTIRAGVDETNFTAGLGYKFDIRIGKKKYPFDINYALIYESEADLWNPISFSLRGAIP